MEIKFNFYFIYKHKKMNLKKKKIRKNNNQKFRHHRRYLFMINYSFFV